ncbi:hypothetical protein C8A01DRAFT_48508 [Parachaetomium inaequale]|uniref:SPT2 chromatin protein n=1 Tax=Parachaetomium inaequale TaxID=2588326 RepID=A0AAN6PD12_9PEZI|nr:hypothetical protein C8A01DRAFT_48508 [Parachaetomium inaequale]
MAVSADAPRLLILDLLASITGEKPSPSSNLVPRPSAPLSKRKAEDEPRPAGVKLARINSFPDKSAGSNDNSPKPSPRPAHRPLDRSCANQASNPRPASDNKRALNERPSAADPKAGSAGTRPANGSKPLPSRPLANRPSPTDSGPPKKRSYAEIMARAKANSEQRESLGKIQHKTVERTLTMKERKEMKVEDARKAKMAARKSATGRPGATSAHLRDVARVSGARNNLPSASAKKTPPVEEKKVKKAALATTGYTGTARPRPGASTTAKPGAPSRPGSEARSRDRPRYGGPLSSSRRGRDEEDDLDDFIVDDEEEEEEQPGYGHARQYRYDSYEEESDMEAGISDIEDEEQLADRQARREDLEQEALEKRLKREKEERRRKFLDATKSKAGR